jgi:hypothetical protein
MQSFLRGGKNEKGKRERIATFNGLKQTEGQRGMARCMGASAQG